MSKFVFPPRIIFDESEKEAALRVIEKTMKGNETIDLYGKGPEIANFEKEFASYFGVKFAAAVSSGTAALHSAIGALRLNPTTEIITSPITDPGTVAPILMQNCIPIFSDVDYETLNISPKSIEEKITEKTKVLIPVHLAGQPCNMDAIMDIAHKHNLMVIEDCAQSIGARYKGKYVGTFGDLGVFSLMGSKHITSGGQGGMIITNNEELYWNVKRFADRGKPFNSPEKTNLFLGLNYRMTEIQAAIGRSQLPKLKKIKEKRIWILDQIRNLLSDSKVFHPWKMISDVEANPWFIFMHYDEKHAKLSKEEIVKILQEEYGIPVGAHYTIPIPEQLWIKNKATYGESQYPWSAIKRRIDYRNCCPEATRSVADHFTLYSHEGWEEKEISYVVESLKMVEKRCLL